MEAFGDQNYEIADNRLIYDLFQAYYDARRNKRNQKNQLSFEVNYESNLFELYHEIISQQYHPLPSVCFIHYEPVKREIFAAHFRDRIVHHLIYNYISPIFERVFINDSYSCRTGKGTSYGIKRVDYFIRSCSGNYNSDCYILKLDIQGYFMSIHKTILYHKVLNTLNKYQYRTCLKTGRNNETWNNQFNFGMVYHLLGKIIFNNPLENCIIKGNINDWKGLPATKSLFHAKPGCGLPIGNLTSQLFSNIYLNDFDHFIKKKLQCRYYGRYVDDFVIIHHHKDFLTHIIPEISAYLQHHLQLTLHPHKIYLQHYRHGVKFLGTYIKPHRIYIANRTKGNFYRSVSQLNNLIQNNKHHTLTPVEKENTVSVVNAYLGITKHYKTYRLRKKMLGKKLSGWFFNYFYISGNYSKLVSKMKRKKHHP